MYKERTLSGQWIQNDKSPAEQASSWGIAQMKRNGVLGSHKSLIIAVKALGAWVHVNISSVQKRRLMWPPSHASAEPDPLHHLHVSFCAASVPLINLGGSNDALSALSRDLTLWRTYIIHQSLEPSIRHGLKKESGGDGEQRRTNGT